jgi:hypothetical protein
MQAAWVKKDNGCTACVASGRVHPIRAYMDASSQQVHLSTDTLTSWALHLIERERDDEHVKNAK